MGFVVGPKLLGAWLTLALLAPRRQLAQAVHTVDVDTAALGPLFDGVGGCSAGTGPRLLVDYPEPARTDLLDLLFLPQHAASLDMLKVEIGGQGDSSTGTEATHEPARGRFDFDSG